MLGERHDGRPGWKTEGSRQRSLVQRDSPREHTEATQHLLAAVVRDRNAPQIARVSAGKELLARGWGRRPAAKYTDEDLTRFVAG